MNKITSTKTRVYIAGPLSIGDQTTNIRNACNVAKILILHNFVPFVPHLYSLWHMIQPKSPEYWYKLDRQWLYSCDLMLVLPGPSSGGIQKEKEWAREFQIPIYGFETFHSKYGIYLFKDIEPVAPIGVKIDLHPQD